MKGATLILCILILQLSLTTTIFRTITGAWDFWRQPTTWLYSTWLIGLVLLSLPIYIYEEEFTLWSGPYICLTLFAFPLGAIAAEFSKRKYKNKTNNVVIPLNTRKLATWLLIAGIIGGMLASINSYLDGGISIGDRLDAQNAQLIRTLHMGGEESHIGPLFGPANASYALGGIGLILYFALKGMEHTTKKSHDILTRLAAYGYFAISTFYSLLFAGGRITIVLNILLSLSAYASARWSTGEKSFKIKSNPKVQLAIIGSVIVAGSLLWLSSTVFLEKRTAKADPDVLLFKTHRARFAPLAQEITASSISAGYALFTLSYASTPIPTLVFYSDLPSNRVPGPLWGQYSFPVLSRYALRAVGQFDPNDWMDARDTVFAPLADINFGTNVWATLVRDLLVDFGFLGSILFMGILGYITQILYIKERTDPTIGDLTLLALLRLLLLFSGLNSLLYMSQYYWPLHFAAFYILYTNRKKKEKRFSI